jgi:hypothetical protein
MSIAKRAVAIAFALVATAASASAQEHVYFFGDPAVTEPPKANHKTLKPPRWPQGARGTAGATTIVACVDGAGQLYAPLLVEGSGMQALDDRFLAWAAETRWLPAKIGNATVSVCGWPVTWIWQAPDLRPPKLPYRAVDDVRPETLPALPAATPKPLRPEGRTPAGYTDSGKQKLEVCVGPTGAVENVSITTGLYNPALNEAIRDWAETLTFTPAIKGGKGVGICGVIFEYTWPTP